MAKKKGLGRGLETLLGPKPTENKKDASMIPLAQLQAGKYQPRSRMDESSLDELAQSIQKQGVLQPIIVRKLENQAGKDAYEIIAGERRYRAAKLAGLEYIPALIKEADDKTAAEIALIENMQREDLNPLEEAQGIDRLIKEFDYTHEQAASAVGRSRSAVSNLLRLLNLAKAVQTMLIAGDIDMGHARALLAVDAATQVILATQVVAKRLSVRETERLVAQRQAEKPAEKKPKKEKSVDIIRLEDELSDLLATKVSFRVSASGSKGQMLIDFADLDVLEGILQKLRTKNE